MTTVMMKVTWKRQVEHATRGRNKEGFTSGKLWRMKKKKIEQSRPTQDRVAQVQVAVVLVNRHPARGRKIVSPSVAMINVS